jgi:hypothetical protein
MSRSVKIVSDYRDPQENEFFFYQDPSQTGGLREMIVWLEQNTDFVFEKIPHWQIRSEVRGYPSNDYGLRVRKK